ncbi:MAG TPA: DUF4124 domain-containing protein [Burkholderiaceae bacterium]|nr:DUF4124 domain-containing protein [Burkholderiaceae bacterium]
MIRTFRVGRAGWTALLALSAVGLTAAYAQQQPVDGIYTCTDAKGRKLRSDRPIPECTDREQNILNPSGTVKAKVGPTLTAQERAAQEEKDKLALEEKARQNEEKRRDRALLLRYPSRAVHDKERAEALNQIGVVVQAANNRMVELRRQRKDIDAEMEFYVKDPSKAPPSVRRQIEDNDQSLAVQKRFIADQESEIKRVNARFDEELVRLKTMWPTTAQATAAQPKKP